MWWIKARAKWILLAVVVLAAAGGGVFFATQQPSDGKPGTDGGTGVRVYQDDQGRVIVANANDVKPELAFALPRNCDEAFSLMKDVIKENGTQAKATPDVRQVFEIYNGLSKQLCSWSRYDAANIDWIKQWYFNPDTWSAPSTTVPAATTTTTTEPAAATSTTTQG